MVTSLCWLWENSRISFFNPSVLQLIQLTWMKSKLLIKIPKRFLRQNLNAAAWIVHQKISHSNILLNKLTSRTNRSTAIYFLHNGFKCSPMMSSSNLSSCLVTSRFTHPRFLVIDFLAWWLLHMRRNPGARHSCT